MTKTYQENCMLCGARLHYEETPRVMRCALCGREAQTNAWCEAGHYICDACHAQDASDVIEAFCLTKKTDDPAAMAREVMKHPKSICTDRSIIFWWRRCCWAPQARRVRSLI